MVRHSLLLPLYAQNTYYEDVCIYVHVLAKAKCYSKHDSCDNLVRIFFFQNSVHVINLPPYTIADVYKWFLFYVPVFLDFIFIPIIIIIIFFPFLFFSFPCGFYLIHFPHFQNVCSSSCMCVPSYNSKNVYQTFLYNICILKIYRLLLVM